MCEERNHSLENETETWRYLKLGFKFSWKLGAHFPGAKNKEMRRTGKSGGKWGRYGLLLRSVGSVVSDHFTLSRFEKTRAVFRVAGHISPILNEFEEDIERWYKWGPARSTLSVRTLFRFRVQQPGFPIDCRRLFSCPSRCCPHSSFVQTTT